MFQQLNQKLMAAICWVCNSHVPEARMRIKDGYMEGYWECSRCGKDLTE